MCNWICTFELCPTCWDWKRITTENVPCEYIASIRGNGQFCPYYRDSDNIIVATLQCENCNNRDDEREAEFDLIELDTIPDVNLFSLSESDSSPHQDSFSYSDSEYEDEDGKSEKGDDASKLYTLGEAVRMSVTKFPIGSKTDADGTEKATGEAAEEASEEISEKVSEEISEEVSEQDSDSEFESLSDTSEVSAYSDDDHHESMGRFRVHFDEDDDVFMIDDVYDDQGFHNEVARHRRVEQLRRGS